MILRLIIHLRSVLEIIDALPSIFEGWQNVFDEMTKVAAKPFDQKDLRPLYRAIESLNDELVPISNDVGKLRGR